MSEPLPSSLSLALSLLLCLLTISSPHPQQESLITGYDLWSIRQVLISYSTMTRSISTHPWKGCQSTAQISQALNSLVPIYTLGWRMKRMKGLGQEHNDPVQRLCWTAGSQVQVTFPYYHPISSHWR